MAFRLSLYLIFSTVVGFLGWRALKNVSFENDSLLINLKNLEEEMIVEVGNQTITKSQIDHEFDLYVKNIGDLSSKKFIPDLDRRLDQKLDSLKEQVFAELLERKLLFEFVKKDEQFMSSVESTQRDCTLEWRSIVAGNSDLGKDLEKKQILKDRMCEWAIVNKYMREVVWTEKDFSLDELRAYYETNKEKFAKPKRALIRQIVLASEREGNRILRKVNRDNFQSYALNYSISPEGKNGGIVGPFSEGQLPPIFDIAFGMRVGEIRGLLKSAYGFHIFQLIEIKPAVEKDFNHFIADVEREIKLEHKEEVYKYWIDSALNSVQINSQGAFW